MLESYEVLNFIIGLPATPGGEDILGKGHQIAERERDPLQ